MSSRTEHIKALKAVFDKAKNAPRDENGYFQDRDLHNDVGDALIDVGKEALYELKGEIYSYLSDIFPDFRGDAVKTLGWDTRLKVPEFRDRAYEIWLSDPDDDVKAVSLSAWAGYYIGTSNPQVLKILYDILCNEKYDAYIRTHVFTRLLEVAEYDAHRDITSYMMLIDESRTNEALNKVIDWNLVKSIMEKYVPGFKS